MGMVGANTLEPGHPQAPEPAQHGPALGVLGCFSVLGQSSGAFPTQDIWADAGTTAGIGIARSEHPRRMLR